jgi:hypothetical protein
MPGHQYMERPIKKQLAKSTNTMTDNTCQNFRIPGERTRLPDLVSSHIKKTPHGRVECYRKLGGLFLLTDTPREHVESSRYLTPSNFRAALFTKSGDDTTHYGGSQIDPIYEITPSQVVP